MPSLHYQMLTNNQVLNTSTDTLIVTPIPSHISKTQILSVLHSNTTMIGLNPIVKSHVLLPSTSSSAFFSSEPEDTTPPSPETTPVYQVVEDMSGEGADGGGGSWRGGWAKRFVPDSITYETSMEVLGDGLRSITHAPLAVNSVTTWLVKEAEGGQGLVLEERGKVTSNRMLMGFIKTTLQQSHGKLVKDFMVVLEKSAADEEGRVEKVS
jgi:hypothetical protein